MAQWRLLEAGQHQVESLIQKLTDNEDEPAGSLEDEDFGLVGKDRLK